MKKLLFMAMSIILWHISFSQNNFRIVFYNVENLFDTHDNLKTLDDEFTPNGAKYWNNYRYWQKIKKISKTIKITGQWDAPAIVGLAEIENDTVLKDLIYSEALKKYNYGYIHRDSPDRRGIDTAILYRKDKFFPLKKAFYPIINENKELLKTREICYTSGLIKGGDTLHIMVVHMPSKYGGYKASEASRIVAANVLINICDSINAIHNRAKIIVMGDFNDEADNKSMEMIENSQNLTVLSPEHGTHKFQSAWNTIDHFVVSSSVLEAGTFKASKKVRALAADFLLINDEKYLGKKTNRTYLGFRYKGGFSDHLPVYFDIEIPENK